MKPPYLALLAVLATLLTCFYLMTARVYIQDSVGENYLLLKPFPSLLISGGDWEDPAWWPPFYDWGILLLPILWISFIFLSVKTLIKKWKSRKTDV